MNRQKTRGNTSAPAAGVRTLASLTSVGKASLEDFRCLAVDSVEALALCDARELYERLCQIKGCTVDICQYDLLCCAVAQARDPHLPPEQCQWFWWSRQRLAESKTAGRRASAVSRCGGRP